jgi:hypothetical protein
MRAAWWISISNFVFPCILQITQVGVVFHVKHQGQTDLQWFNECSVMMVLNGYFTIMGVVLATVWAEATNSSTISVSSGIRAPRKCLDTSQSHSYAQLHSVAPSLAHPSTFRPTSANLVQMLYATNWSEGLG